MHLVTDCGAPNPLVVNTPVLCTGLDSSGIPVHPQGSFFESDTSRRPLNVYIPVQNALPGKTALQVRWLVGGKQESSSALFSPDMSDGAILVPYRGLLSAGSHRVVVVADCVERGSVTFTVSPSRAREKAADVSSPAAPVQPAPQARVQALPEPPPPVAEPSPRVLQELPAAASQNPA